MRARLAAAPAAALLALLALSGCTINIPADAEADNGRGKDSAAEAEPSETETSQSPFFEASDPDEDLIRPTKGDFSLKLKTTGSECFGSAGCLIDYKIGLTWLGPISPEPKLDGSYDLYYRVSGTDNGPQTGTLTVTPKLRYSIIEDYASTPQGGKLSVELLRISKAGRF